METLRQKWERIIKEYEHQERVRDDQYPSIPWTKENEWKIISNKWVDFSHHFLEELSGLMQDQRFEDAEVLLDLMIAKWEELFA
jgi:hypothetical protein